MTTRRRFLGSITGLTIAGVTLDSELLGRVRAAGSEWPTFQGDAARTGFTDAVEAPVTDVEIDWQQEIGPPIHSQPVRADGQVIVAATDRNNDTGQLVGLTTMGDHTWSQTPSLAVLSTPAIGSERVFQTDLETLVARSPTDGTIEWSARTSPSVFSSPLVVGDRIVVGTRLGTLKAFSTADGSDRWTANLGGVVSATPAANDDVVVAGTDEGTAVAVDPADGEVRWERDLGSPIRVPVTIADGSALVATEAGRLHALELGSGNTRWTTDEERPTASSPVCADNTCYWGNGSRVTAIDLADGTERWTTDTDGYTALNHVAPSPVATRNTLYVSTGSATIYALDQSDGSERWTFSPPSGSDVLSLSVGDGRLYAGTDDGVLYALSGRTNYRPDSSFSYAPRDPSPGEEVTFDAANSADPDGSIETYRWDFDGDGEFEATGPTVTRSLSAGEHTIRLEVVDDEGARGVTEQTATISAGPVSTTAPDTSNNEVAAYVDRVPGEELGVAGGAVGLLGMFGLYRLLAGDGTESDDSPANDREQADGQSPNIPREASDSDKTRVHPASGRDVAFEDLTVGERLGSGLLTEVSEGTVGAKAAPVAVETLSGSSSHTVHEDLFEQFADGVDVWSRIDEHPNVVSVVASGTEPFPWAALERCSAQLRPGAVADRSFSAIRDLLVDVLEGLHYGHRHGLFHGALAPSNVLLLPPDRAGSDRPVAVVSDWEVSAAKLDRSLDAADVYPRFASPEQIEPERFREPDSRTDTYQVGLLAYALTTGSYLFDESTDAVEARGTDAIAPPSTRASDVPNGLDEVIATALAPDPEDRYQTALHFRDALERL